MNSPNITPRWAILKSLGNKDESVEKNRKVNKGVAKPVANSEIEIVKYIYLICDGGNQNLIFLINVFII